MDRLFKKNKDKEKKKAKRLESEEKSLGKNIKKFIMSFQIVYIGNYFVKKTV